MNGTDSTTRQHLLVGCFVLLLAARTSRRRGTGQINVAGVASLVTSTWSASPSPLSAAITMSAGVQALKQAIQADGRLIGAPVLIRGSFALASVPADEVVAVSAEQDLKCVSAQVTFGSFMLGSPTVHPVIRPALIS